MDAIFYPTLNKIDVKRIIFIIEIELATSSLKNILLKRQKKGIEKYILLIFRRFYVGR